MATGDGYLRFFPYDEPFVGQQEAMDRIYNALVREQDVLFEGACGTGKTLASLAPALEYARTEDKTVVITTNVHQQTRQFRREAQAIQDSEPIKALVFQGKGSMCHRDVEYEECQLLRDNTYELVDRERDLQELNQRQEELLARSQTGDQQATADRNAVINELSEVETELEELRERSTCEYFYNNLTESTDEFYQWLFDDVRTPAEIYEYADQRTLCGYELLKDGLGDVDLVVCNYHHLLDADIRRQFYRWLDVDPSETIIVFDEAHNIADAAREHARETISERTIDSALEELAALNDERTTAARNVIGPFAEALTTVYERELGSIAPVGDTWQDIAIANEDRRDEVTLTFLKQYTGAGIETDLETAVALGNDLQAQYEAAYRDGDADQRRDSPTLTTARFLSTWLAESESLSRYPVVSVRRDRSTDEVYGQAELYTSIPREVTDTLFGEAYASVLMSATLRPFGVLQDVLGLTDPATIVSGLSFPPEHRQTMAVDTPPLFASNRDDPTVQDTISHTLQDAIRFTPGNTLVFFPSYAEASRYHEQLTEQLDIPCYLDQPGEDATGLRQQFVEESKAVLLTSLWGTLTEGVSFDGEDARSVIVVGVPYPRLDDRTEAIQAAYDRAFADRDVSDPGWRYAIEIPTIRKTRQALGRVIRSPDDIGTRILLDRRYTAGGAAELGDYSVYSTLPEELRTELVDVAPDKLKFSLLNFYQRHDAYDGTPPRP